MQTVSQLFTDYAQADIRLLNWKVLMSFDKVFNDSIDFFTIGTSLIGSGDFIPSAGDVVQEWDKYIYQDFSSRVLGIEWSKQVEPFVSVTLGIADIVFDNHDDYFTPDSNSPIADYILPYRPIRILAGFRDQLIPVFIGLTEMPVIDEKTKTVRFHCVDFMSSILNRPIEESPIYVDQSVDTILEGIFDLAGIDITQLDLDNSSTFIPVAYFPTGTKLKNAVGELMEADMGRIYMDENGVITYRNRQNYSSTSVYNFNAYDNIFDIKTKSQDSIANVVEIRGQIREVQPKQSYWDLPSSIEVPANSSVELWASFKDPVTSVDIPVNITTATSSYFSINTESDGSGDSSTNVTLTSNTSFAESYKMTFTNSGNILLYITEIKLFATPATVIQELNIREQDDDSVSLYDERVITLENNFFQSSTDAQSLALVALADYSDFGKIYELDVKGTMALQIDDTITVDIFGRIDTYKITKIKNKISTPAKYTQLLNVKKFTPRNYFTIGVSLIGGTDEIRP